MTLSCLIVTLVATFVVGDAASEGLSSPNVTFSSPYSPSFEAKVWTMTDDRQAAVTFSNQFAGYRKVDPLVAPGAPESDHLHAWLGSRLSSTADLNALFDEPRDWEAGSNAAESKIGFAAEVTRDGQRDGYTSGVWWPAIWDAPPGRVPKLVTYRDGIATYYLASNAHGSDYLNAYPNGLSFLVDSHLMKWDNRSKGQFRVNFFGPRYWDGKRLTAADHRSHVSRSRSATHDVPIPEFQTYIKANLAYPADDTPLEERIKFGNPGAFRPAHLDYVAAYRQPWFLQWLLDMGPNWGHPDNPLRRCGVDMPGTLQRRKLEGVRVSPTDRASASSCPWKPRFAVANPPAASPSPSPPSTVAPGPTTPAVSDPTSPAAVCEPLETVRTGHREVVLDWPAVDRANEYRVVWKSVADGAMIGRTKQSGTGVRIAGLQPGLQIQVEMRAFAGLMELCRSPRLRLIVENSGQVRVYATNVRAWSSTGGAGVTPTASAVSRAAAPVPLCGASAPAGQSVRHLPL